MRGRAARRVRAPARRARATESTARKALSAQGRGDEDGVSRGGESEGEVGCPAGAGWWRTRAPARVRRATRVGLRDRPAGRGTGAQAGAGAAGGRGGACATLCPHLSRTERSVMF